MNVMVSSVKKIAAALNREPIKFLVKLAVTLAIFYLIFRSVPLLEVIETMAGVNPLYLFAALVFQFLSTAAASWRWYLLMRRLGFKSSEGFYFRSYFKGSMFNQVLPTSIGGDAIRVLDVSRASHCRKRDAFYAVAVDRGIGLMGLLLMTLVANLFMGEILPAALSMLLFVLPAAGLAGLAGLVLFYRSRWLSRVWGFSLLHALGERLDKTLASVGGMAVHVPLSVFIHILSVVAIYHIAHGLGMNYGLLLFLAIVPPVFLLLTIPVSIAGWGVREGAMLGLFLLVGADETLVISMSILYGLTVIVSSLPGLYFYWTSVHKKERR